MVGVDRDTAGVAIWRSQARSISFQATVAFASSVDYKGFVIPVLILLVRG